MIHQSSEDLSHDVKLGKSEEISNDNPLYQNNQYVHSDVHLVTHLNIIDFTCLNEPTYNEKLISSLFDHRFTKASSLIFPTPNHHLWINSNKCFSSR
jgi:hypothetical protein